MSRCLVALLPLLVACSEEANPERVDDIIALEADVTNGAAEYSASCAGCHGANGGGGSGPTLAGAGFVQEEVVEALLTGPGSMPNFDNEDDQTLADISAFVLEL